MSADALKRRVYGLPVMRWYRGLRARQVAERSVKTSYGFNFAGDQSYLEPAWEVEERKVLQSLFPRVTAFIDVGANHGIYTCLAASAGLPVAAVEPEEGNLRILRANIAQFPDVEIFPVALSGERGVVDLYGDGPTASLCKGWLNTPNSFRRPVRTDTMDSLFAARWPGGRVLIKVDVEGAEGQVIAGAQRMMRRDPIPYWLIEMFPGPATERIVRQFEDAGYTLHPLEWYNYVCTDDPDFALPPVRWMKFDFGPIFFEKTFSPAVARREAVAEILAEARRRGFGR